MRAISVPADLEGAQVTLRAALDAVRLQALLSRLDPHAGGTCRVEGCEHEPRTAPRPAAPPRRPSPVLRAA
jgi:hypothetical protein